jgi:hypothetical protein
MVLSWKVLALLMQQRRHVDADLALKAS